MLLARAPDDYRGLDLRALRDTEGGFLPFLTPRGLDSATAAGRPRLAGAGEVLDGAAAARALEGTNAELFYAQALEMGEYLRTRGGSGVLRLLAEQLAGGRDLGRALAAAHRAAPSVPADVSKLEGAWLAWLTRPSERPDGRAAATD